MTRISVILTTYNRPAALVAVLRGLAVQTDRDFEIVVADDGSGPETAVLLADWAARLPVPLLHVWQEDRGFRAAAARNRALAQASGNYVVFLDGDCVPRPNFLAAHRRLAAAGWFVAGNRVLLAERFTGAVLARSLPIHTWGLGDWASVRLRGGINRLLPLLDLPDGQLRRHRPRRWQGAKTCNLAVWYTDLIRVNGLDETYSGWGHEDADLVVRLLNAGVRRKDGHYATTVLHLWHPKNDRGQLSDNESRLAASLATCRIRAECGLDQYG
jgi:glycosyltransferase involved in cell wall biosynthesis